MKSISAFKILFSFLLVALVTGHVHLRGQSSEVVEEENATRNLGYGYGGGYKRGYGYGGGYKMGYGGGSKGGYKMGYGGGYKGGYKMGYGGGYKMGYGGGYMKPRYGY